MRALFLTVGVILLTWIVSSICKLNRHFKQVDPELCHKISRQIAQESNPENKIRELVLLETYK